VLAPVFSIARRRSRSGSNGERSFRARAGVGRTIGHQVDRARAQRQQNIAAFGVLEHRASISPNISDKTVREMLIQHLMTETRLSQRLRQPRLHLITTSSRRKSKKKVIRALTSQTFSRAEFLKSNDYFYRALEAGGDHRRLFAEAGFLNMRTLLFKGFSVKIADTRIVYATADRQLHGQKASKIFCTKGVPERAAMMRA